MTASKSDGPISPHFDPPCLTDDDDETRDETKLRQIVLRVDDRYRAALQRIADNEGLSKTDALKRLIRLADQLISGEKSPFRSLDLEILRKVG